MKKKTAFALMISTALLLSGCMSKEPAKPEVPVIEVPNLVTPVIPSGENYYRTSLPYLASKSKGTVASSNSRLDLNRQELGLLELAQTKFSPNTFMFQEGQYISSDDVEDWLGRYHSEKNRLGLNPETGSNQLIHILEHDYLQIDSQELGGMVIGLAVSSVVKNAEDKEERLEIDALRSIVEQLAARIVERVRANEVTVPILIAGFALEPSSSVLPGNYINLGTVAAGETVVSKWSPIEEHHVVYPGRKSSTESEKEFGNIFSDFQKEVQSFFPQYSGVTGVVRFLNDEPREMSVTVRASYSSRTEVIAFTQFISGLIADYFPESLKVNVYVESANKSEAIYIRPAKGEPFFHVYR